MKYGLVSLSVVMLCVAARAGTIETFFTPGTECQEAVIREVNAAKTEIKVQAYVFTNVQIARAIHAARGRGVGVEVILDKSQRKRSYSCAKYFLDAGIAVLVYEGGELHSNIIIVDHETVLAGSYSFKRHMGEKNVESLLVIKGFSEVTANFLADFQKRRAASYDYNKPPAPKASKKTTPGRRPRLQPMP